MKKNLLTLVAILSVMNAIAQSWNMQNIGFHSQGSNPFLISVVNSNTVWAISATDLVTAPSTEFSRTIDAGVTWQTGNVPLPNGYALLNVAGVDQNTAYVGSVNLSGSGTKLYKTIDGGVTWSVMGIGSFFNSSSSFIDQVHFWDASHGIVIGDPLNNKFEIYTTIDSGNTWNKVQGTSIPNAISGEFPVPKTFDFEGSCIWFSTNQGRLFKSTDYGLHWTIANSTLGFSFISFLSDTLTGLAETLGNYDYSLTTDGGVTWSPINYSGPAYFMVRSIPGTNIFVSFSGPPNDPNNFGSSYSTDLGNTWIPIDTFGLGTTNGYGWMEFKDINTGWASGICQDSLHDGIYKWNAGLLGINNPSTNKSTLEVFPNPATDKIFVRGINQNAVIQLFDVTGRIVFEKKFSESVSMNESIDLKNYAPGLYVIKAQNNKQTQFAKFILK